MTVYPDIVALLVAYLDPLTTVRVASDVPNPRLTELIQVRRVGGTQLRPVRDKPRVDFIVWAATSPRANEIADLVRNAVHQLAGTATLGPVVDRSIIVLTREPWRIPLSPRLTDWTIGGVGRLMKTTSDFDATSSADAALVAPRSVSGFTTAGFVSYTHRE